MLRIWLIVFCYISYVGLLRSSNAVVEVSSINSENENYAGNNDINANDGRIKMDFFPPTIFCGNEIALGGCGIASDRKGGPYLNPATTFKSNSLIEIYGESLYMKENEIKDEFDNREVYSSFGVTLPAMIGIGSSTTGTSLAFRFNPNIGLIRLNNIDSALYVNNHSFILAQSFSMDAIKYGISLLYQKSTNVVQDGSFAQVFKSKLYSLNFGLKYESSIGNFGLVIKNIIYSLDYNLEALKVASILDALKVAFNLGTRRHILIYEQKLHDDKFKMGWPLEMNIGYFRSFNRDGSIKKIDFNMDIDDIFNTKNTKYLNHLRMGAEIHFVEGSYMEESSIIVGFSDGKISGGLATYISGQYFVIFIKGLEEFGFSIDQSRPFLEVLKIYN